MIGGSPIITAILEAILPYLIAKKEQAELLLRFTRSRIDTNNWNPYTIDPEQMAMELRRLNRKGRVSSAFDDHEEKFPMPTVVVNEAVEVEEV